MKSVEVSTDCESPAVLCSVLCQASLPVSVMRPQSCPRAGLVSELQELRDGADRHSLFIFDRGDSSGNLPSYQNHVLAKEANVVLEEEDQDEAGPSCAVTARGQRGIASFFHVTLEQACSAGCRRRPFPMQLHQLAKSTHSAKSQ